MNTANFSRRQLLQRLSNGFGWLAARSLLGSPPQTPRFKPKAKSVIFCYMSGGVSHVDSFDPKPLLAAKTGQPMPMPLERTQFNNNGNILGSPWEFKRYGQSGLPVSDLFPHVGSCADDLCVVRSMTAKFNEHAQGNYFTHTGLPFSGYPSAGAWMSYGLGTATRNLPGFVVLQSGDAAVPHGGVGIFGNGFLPAVHQASVIRADAPDPVRHIRPSEPLARQRARLSLTTALDQPFLERVANDGHVEAAIANYEQAFSMQSAVPELCDLRGETETTKKLYGMDSPDAQKAAYGRQCLLARRLVERGVRFVELSCLSYGIGGGNAPNPWDQHGDLRRGHEKMSFQVDQPIAGLLKDLKSRGLLDETLVIWAGEFGRTPFSQGKDGRDHNPFGFSVWMAGGGMKGGSVYGATDEYGYKVTENPVTYFDLWATVLHAMGLDHEELTFLHGGRNIRLTDVHGHVMHDWMA